MSTASTAIHTEDVDTREATTHVATLYDLIAAVQNAAGPGKDDLVVSTLDHLFRSRRVTWQTPVTPSPL